MWQGKYVGHKSQDTYFLLNKMKYFIKKIELRSSLRGNIFKRKKNTERSLVVHFISDLPLLLSLLWLLLRIPALLPKKKNIKKRVFLCALVSSAFFTIYLAPNKTHCHSIGKRWIWILRNVVVAGGSSSSFIYAHHPGRSARTVTPPECAPPHTIVLLKF